MIGHHSKRNVLLNKAGQGSLEFVATLPLYLLLFFVVLYFGLYLWMQIIASVALHDGVRVTAETGNVASGYERARTLMEAGLGGLASGPESTLAITVNSAARGVQGRIDYAWRTELVGFGITPLSVRASSFARLEGFYGGPPGGIE